MRNSNPAWLNWEKLDITATVSGKLFRNPENPFEAFDEYGEPCLPMTIGDESASSGGTLGQPGDAPGGVDLHTGKMSAAVLAPRLHWGAEVCANAHEQEQMMYKGRPVPVDINIAPLVEAMWGAGFVTLACCEGNNTDTETAYVMFSEPIGKRFMEWAQAHDQHLPEGLTRRFEILLQDSGWDAYMKDRYPLLEPVVPDAEGRLFTLSWRFHRHELLDYRDRLVELLDAGPR